MLLYKNSHKIIILYNFIGAKRRYIDFFYGLSGQIRTNGILAFF